MAGKVFFSVTMSLDGFIAPEERMDDADVQRWMAQWMEPSPWPPGVRPCGSPLAGNRATIPIGDRYCVWHHRIALPNRPPIQSS